MGSDCVVDIDGIVDHHCDTTLCVRPVETGRRAASSLLFSCFEASIHTV